MKHKIAANRQRKHKIVKGDRVKVIRGNYREKEGTVLQVLTDEDRVVVEGVNMRKHHQRPSQANTGDASRIRVQVEDDGTKERIATKSGNPIPKPR